MSTTEDLTVQDVLPHPVPPARFPNAASACRTPVRPPKRPPPIQRPLLTSPPHYPVPRQTNPGPQDIHKTNQKTEELKDVITQQPQTQPPVRRTANSIVDSAEGSMVPRHKEEKQPIIKSKLRIAKKKRVKEESERNCCCFCCQTLCYEVCTQFQTQLL